MEKSIFRNHCSLSFIIIIAISVCKAESEVSDAKKYSMNNFCENFHQTAYIVSLHAAVGNELSKLFEYYGTVFSVVPIYHRLLQIYEVAAPDLKTEIESYLGWNKTFKDCYNTSCSNLLVDFPFNMHTWERANLSIGYSSTLFYANKLKLKREHEGDICFKTRSLDFKHYSSKNSINQEYKEASHQTSFRYLLEDFSHNTELFILNTLAVDTEFFVDFKMMQNFTRKFIDITGEERKVQWYHKHNIHRYYSSHNGYNWTVYLDELNGDFNFIFIQLDIKGDKQEHFEWVKNRNVMRNVFQEMGNFTEFLSGVFTSKRNTTGTMVIPKIHHSLRIDLQDEVFKDNITKIGDKDMVSNLFVNHSSKLLSMEYAEFCMFKNFEYDLIAEPDFVLDYPFIGMLVWKANLIPIKTVIYFSPPPLKKRCY